MNIRHPLKSHRTRPSSRNRSGSILVLAVAAFAAVAIVGGMSVNLAYMEVVGTEQRMATDAAAKAASITLGLTQSPQQARQKAHEIAAGYSVAGKPFVLADADIVFGRSNKSNDGRFTFTAASDGSANLNSVRIRSDLDTLGDGGAPILLMNTVFNPNKFSPVREAVATRIDIDVALVVDRSGSMAWDISNIPFQYPEQDGRFALNQRYVDLPDPVLSRWAALTESVGVFSDVLRDSPYEPRVALASYASNFNFGVWSSTVASIDMPLSDDFAGITGIMDQIGSKPLIGNTNISAGLREGIAALTDPAKSRVTSTKVIVLLSDGVLTQGSSPVDLANVARELNIKVNTIAFSAQADVELMQAIATAGGGYFYNAPDAETLNDVFQEIAETLPAMLTQ